MGFERGSDRETEPYPYLMLCLVHLKECKVCEWCGAWHLLCMYIYVPIKARTQHF